MKRRLPTVYFVQSPATGYLKIGYTALPVRQRVSQLQVGAGVKLILLAETAGSEEDEARLHAIFAPYRVMGEWFKPEKAIMDLVAGLLDGARLSDYLLGSEPL